MHPLHYSYAFLESRLRRCNISDTESPDTPDPTPDPNTLPGLPPELLVSISDFLYSADLICLSLCNRRLFAVLDRQRKRLTLPLYRSSGKLCVLGKLARDLPNYFICEVCIRLHKYDGSKCLGISIDEWEEACGILCWAQGKWETCQLSWRIRRELQSRSHDTLYNLFTQLIVRSFHEGPP
jgi:hypothetical protein